MRPVTFPPHSLLVEALSRCESTSGWRFWYWLLSRARRHRSRPRRPDSRRTDLSTPARLRQPANRRPARSSGSRASAAPATECLCMRIAKSVGSVQSDQSVRCACFVTNRPSKARANRFAASFGHHSSSVGAQLSFHFIPTINPLPKPPRCFLPRRKRRRSRDTKRDAKLPLRSGSRRRTPPRDLLLRSSLSALLVGFVRKTVHVVKCPFVLMF